MFHDVHSPPLGELPRQTPRRFTLRDRAWRKGEIAGLDLANASGFATNSIVGDRLSQFANLTVPTERHVLAGPVYVVDADTAQNSPGVAWRNGIVQARVGSADGEIVQGATLTIDISGAAWELTDLAVYNGRWVARALESISNSFVGDAGLCWVLFTGDTGMGQYF